MFLKESLHGVQKKAGGVGGGRSPPPICTHDVFITGSERGHMGSVFAGRMILAVALYSLKKCGGWGGRSPPRLQMDCQHDGFEKLYNNDAREASLVDGAMFLKASLHGVERKRGG